MKAYNVKNHRGTLKEYKKQKARAYSLKQIDWATKNIKARQAKTKAFQNVYGATPQSR